MIQKKLNNNRVFSSLHLHIICIISVLAMNLVNISRGIGMEQRQRIGLDQLIRESVQRHYIEGHVIENLKTIHGSEIFDEKFRKILLDAFSRRQEQAFLDENFSRQQGDLAKLFVPFNDAILNTLRSDPEIPIKFIRRLMDLEKSDVEIFGENQTFFTKVNQMFYQSKQLLNFVSLPEITKIYIKNPTAKFNKIEFTGKQTEIEQTTKTFKEVLQTQVCKVSLDEKKYLLHSASKSNGKHFGTIVRSYIIGPEKRQILEVSREKTFFLKSYSMGYPAINNTRGSDGAAYDTTKDITSYQKDNIVIQLPNLRELMGYKILEHLGLGPKTHFIINPYITYGLFILTDGLDDDQQQFVEENYFAIEQNENLKEEISAVYFECENFKYPKTFYPVISLTELHLTSLIFNLVDMKQDNIGYIIKKSSGTTSKLSDDFYNKDRKWFIIDFLVNEDDSPELKNSFLSGNFFHDAEGRGSVAAELLRTRYGLKEKQRKLYFGYQALKQFDARLNQYKLDYRELFNGKEQIEGEQILETLLQQQSQYIKDLMNTERGESEDETMLRHPTEKVQDKKRFRNRTNAELIGFKNGNAPVYDEHSLDNLNEEAKKLETRRRKKEQLQYLTGAFEDLDIYSKSIVQNYIKLKTFINDEHNKYFDENGNLRSVKFQQQDQPQQQPQNQENQQ